MLDVHDYADRIDYALAPGFAISELVRNGSPRHSMPPASMWSQIEPTLILANKLRDRMIEHGAKGLRVAAAYRPRGGAANSRHKFNQALDLDLLPADYDKTRTYYEEVVRLWCETGRDLKVGLGLYCPRDAQQGIRVHLDVGYKTRHWQHGAGAGTPDAVLIAKRLGIELPVYDPDEDEGSDEP